VPKKFLAGICGLLVVAAIILLFRAPRPSGDELAAQPGGWSGSYEVGSTFTDGLNLVTITHKGTEPIVLISAEPIMTGDTLKVLGERARIVPDMLPDSQGPGWFQSVPGFPATTGAAAGGVGVKGLVVRPSGHGEYRWIEIQVGYRVVRPGRSTRSGIALTYRYAGQVRRMIIPNRLAVCAPAAVTCRPE
jgi:hypothetical protein